MSLGLCLIIPVGKHTIPSRSLHTWAVGERDAEQPSVKQTEQRKECNLWRFLIYNCESGSTHFAPDLHFHQLVYLLEGVFHTSDTLVSFPTVLMKNPC